MGVPILQQEPMTDTNPDPRARDSRHRAGRKETRTSTLRAVTRIHILLRVAEPPGAGIASL